MTPPVKLEPALASSSEVFDEEILVAQMSDTIAAAASRHRQSADEDPRSAARRAAVDLAVATLRASSLETADHSEDVDVIAEGIGHRLGLSGRQLEDVMVAARLHDIGKLGIPVEVIEKPGPLTGSEWAAIRRHTIVGEQILLAVPELRGAAHLVRHSHERWDGRGYPDGLAGEEIPIGSRIVFCADAFHAIRSDRSYRPGRTAAEALAEIRSCAGTQFDPAVVEALDSLSHQLRRSRNGARSKGPRARKLLALMMVISVGACGSAFARSGWMPEAKSPPRAANRAVPGGPSPTAPVFEGGSTSLDPGQPGAAPRSDGAQRALQVWLGSPDSVTGPLTIPPAALTALNGGELPAVGAPGLASPSEAPGDSKNGSHDSGHAKAKGEADSSIGKAKVHADSIGKLAAEAGASGKDHLGSGKHAKFSHPSVGNKGSAGPGHVSQARGSGGGGGAAKAPKPPAPPKVPKAPKPPAPPKALDPPAPPKAPKSTTSTVESTVGPVAGDGKAAAGADSGPAVKPG